MDKERNQVGGSHYQKMKIEPIVFIMGNNLDFCQGNIIKYVCRYKDKNGIQDLRKAKQYIIKRLKANIQYINKKELECCDAIYMLSDYKESEGAMQELEMAEKLNKEIIYQQSNDTSSKTDI